MKSLSVLVLMAFLVAAPAFAQPAKKAPPPPSAELLEQERQAAVKEMEHLMVHVRVPFPKGNVPDEVRLLCYDGQQIVAMRFGAYGSLFYDLGVDGRPRKCK